MWFTNLKPKDITYKEGLRLGTFAQVMLVDVRGHTCVMKVYHNFGPDPNAPTMEIETYTCERKAYERLNQHGLCDRGLVPKFYGVLENLNVDDWQPLLASFYTDEFPQCAIILEYIPGMRSF